MKTRYRKLISGLTAGLCTAFLTAGIVPMAGAHAAETGAMPVQGSLYGAATGIGLAKEAGAAGNGADASAAGGENTATAAPAEKEAVYTPAQQAQIEAFYANTVLAGDSVLLGFRNYCRSGDPVMKGLNFLAAGSLSLHNAFWPVSKKSVHPLYQGEQHPVWESVQMIAPDRVFLFFGINDMVYGVDDSVETYKELIAKIREVRPEAKIYILSATYMLEGTEKKNLNNTNLAQFNERMAVEAAQNGWGFVDLAGPTSDGRGYLHPAYCTDGFLHQNKAAYRVWERVLKDYALTQTP